MDIASLASLNEDQKKSIPIDQLARLLFADFRGREGGGPYHQVNVDTREHFIGRNAREPLKTELANKYDTALQILLDRGLIRWAGGRSPWDFPNVGFQITGRGMASTYDAGWVPPPEPAIANVKAVIAPVKLDEIIEAYTEEAVGALYAERLLSVELCMGIVAERVASILWEQWLSGKITKTRLKTDGAYALIEACIKGLGEVRPNYQAEERDQIDRMVDAMAALGHVYRETRNDAAHPELPRAPDEATVAVQIAALLHRYVPALYRVLKVVI